MYAKQILQLKPSFTREILRYTQTQDIISFAGGLPDSQFLDATYFEMLYSKVIKKNGQKIFQYGPTQGLESLRQQIVSFCNLKEMNEDNILITSGSSEALDIVCRAFANPKENISVQNPSYLNALELFLLYDLNIQQNIDDAKLHYIITQYHNPTNTSFSKKEYESYQKRFENKNTIVIEDNPYQMLDIERNFDAITNYLPDNGITLGSFSKVAAPDFRIGFIAAKKEFIDIFIKIKALVNLQTGYLNQYLLDEWIRSGDFEIHRQKIARSYYEKSAFFHQALKDILQHKATSHSDIGGMFAWVEFPHADTQKLFEKSIKRDVAFVPGRYFMIDSNKPSSFARFNFTNATYEQIIQGLKILNTLI